MRWLRPSDAKLVRRAVDGDRAAFETLVGRYYARGCAIALAHGVQQSDADDLLQDVVLRCFRSLRTLREPGVFGAWFLSAVRNGARDLGRRRRRDRERLSQHEAEPLDVTEAPLAALARAELDVGLRDEVLRLPESLRETVLLYYFDGESSARTAEALGISPAAVRQRLKSARDQLRDRLWRRFEESIRERLPAQREARLRGVALAATALGSARDGRAPCIDASSEARPGVDAPLSTTLRSLAGAVVATGALLVVGLAVWSSGEDLDEISSAPLDIASRERTVPSAPESRARNGAGPATRREPVEAPREESAAPAAQERSVANAPLEATPPPAATLDGVVVDDETALPLESVAVAVRAAESISEANQIDLLTDAEGRFTCEASRPESVAIELRLEGYAPARYLARVDRRAPGRVFRLARGRGVELRVGDGSGQPLAGASVTATWTLPAERVHSGHSSPRLTTDENGSVDCALPATFRDLEIEAQRSGYATAVLSFRTSPLAERVDVTLARLVVLRGEVVTQNGTPPERLDVRAELLLRTRTRAVTPEERAVHCFPGDVGDSLPGWTPQSWTGVRLETRVGAGGSFEVDAPEGHALLVFVAAPGCAAHGPQSIDDWDRSVPRRFELARGYELEGAVARDDGRSVDEFSASLVPLEPRDDAPSRSTALLDDDGSGHFAWYGLHAGAYRLECRWRGREVGLPRAIHVGAGPLEPVEVILDADRPRRRLRVGVLRPDGSPLTDAAVSAYERPGRRVHLAPGPDAAGVSTIEVEVPVELILKVEPQRDAPFFATDPALRLDDESIDDVAVELTAPRGVAVSGTLVDSAGVPRSGVTVFLGAASSPLEDVSLTHRALLRTLTRADGSFAFPNAPEGLVDLRCDPRGELEWEPVWARAPAAGVWIEACPRATPGTPVGPGDP